jgi:hypothetical protein
MNEDQEFFVLGYWGNPYRAGGEYFWMRGFDTRKEAVKAGKRKQKVGQPKTFIDWVSGKNQVFSNIEGFLKAAKKVGLNPRIDD